MKILNAVIIFIICFLIQSCGHSRSKKAPNILIIVADDLGWNDVSFHGSDIKTPSIDEFANESMEFIRFYVSSICSPTRAGLLTGKYPDRFKLRGHVYSPRHIGGIPPKVKMLPKLLKEAGYGETAAFGKWHLGHSNIKYHPNSRGFDLFYGHYNGAIDYFTHERDGELDWHLNNKPNHDQGYSTDLVEKKVIHFVEKSDRTKPFFAYAAFNAPHSPMQAKKEDLMKYGYDPHKPNEDYPVGGGSSFDKWASKNYGMQGRGNTLRQTYSAMVSGVDRSIGHILKVLKKDNLDKNTIVWLISDNGADPHFGGNNLPLRGGKFTQWEGGVRVVSLLRWPGKTKPGTKNNQLTAYIDIVPTLLKNVTGGKAKIDNFDGKNIIGSINGETLPRRFLYLGGSGIVTQQWKMNKGELFKIEGDPYEKNNIADQYSDTVKMLNNEIEKFKGMFPKPGSELRPKDWKPPKDWTMPK